MAQPTVQARPRSVVGKKVKTLRRKGILPANIYGHNRASQPLELDAHAFNLLQRRLSANGVVELAIDGGRPQPAMIQRTQRDVRTGQPIHVEFFQINPRERLTAHVPLVLMGEPEAVRRGEAVLLQELMSIEVSCLLSDLPEALEVHLSHLKQLGDAILVRDLAIDQNRVEIKANLDDRVVSLTGVQAYEEPETVVAASGAASDAETTGEAAPEA